MNGTVLYLCYQWTHFLTTKSKGVTIQMKALDEYILMVLLVLLRKSRFIFWQTKSKGVTMTQLKALDEYILMVLLVLLLKSSFSYKRNLKVWPLKRKLSMSTF